MTESGVHSSGFITRDVNGAGARSAVNLHAACEEAEAGNGLGVAIEALPKETGSNG
jgi:hypothetical protein